MSLSPNVLLKVSLVIMFISTWLMLSPTRESSYAQKLMTFVLTESNNKTISSEDASHMAYDKAKSWNQNAIVWQVQSAPQDLADGWQDNDQSQIWFVDFADPTSKKLYRVKIAGNKIEYDWEKEGNAMLSKFEASYPKDSPAVTMARAAGSAIAHGASSDERPAVTYSIDNAAFAYHGKPVWQFTYPSTGTVYVIDGVTGDYLETVETERALK